MSVSPFTPGETFSDLTDLAVEMKEDEKNSKYTGRFS
jgi:hypothetical protein